MVARLLIKYGPTEDEEEWKEERTRQAEHSLHNHAQRSHTCEIGPITNKSAPSSAFMQIVGQGENVRPEDHESAITVFSSEVDMES